MLYLLFLIYRRILQSRILSCKMLKKLKKGVDTNQVA